MGGDKKDPCSNPGLGIREMPIQLEKVTSQDIKLDLRTYLSSRHPQSTIHPFLSPIASRDSLRNQTEQLEHMWGGKVPDRKNHFPTAGTFIVLSCCHLVIAQLLVFVCQKLRDSFFICKDTSTFFGPRN